MWGTETGLKQSAVEKCFSFIVPSVSLKKGGLCWSLVEPHVVYQARFAPQDIPIQYSFGWFCSVAIARSCLIKHNPYKHLLYIVSWCDTSDEIHNVPDTSCSAQEGLLHSPLKSKCYFGSLDSRVKYLSSSHP